MEKRKGKEDDQGDGDDVNPDEAQGGAGSKTDATTTARTLASVKAKAKAEPKPAAKEKRKARAKSKKAAKTNKADAEPMEDDPQPEAKDTIADTAEEKNDKEEKEEKDEKEENEEEMITPKKALFQESDGEDDVMQRVPNTIQRARFVDPRTGKEESLEELFNKYLPHAWQKSKPNGDKGNAVLSASSASAANKAMGLTAAAAKPEATPKKASSKRRAKAKAKASPKAKAKSSPKPKAAAKASAKAKAKAKAKSSPKKRPELDSPSIKKEIKRRKQRQEQVMETQGEQLEDELMQGVLTRICNCVKDLDDAMMREELRNRLCQQVGNTYMSAYWKTLSVGVVDRDKNGVANKHLTLFSSRAASHPNVNMALAYGSAWLMVSCCV